MRKEYEHQPDSSRYDYDRLLWNPENGFSTIDTGQDFSHYGTWANPETLIIFKFIEGDCRTTFCDNIEEFKEEILSFIKWNEMNGIKFDGISPGSNKKAIDLWEALGFKDLLV